MSVSDRLTDANPQQEGASLPGGEDEPFMYAYQCVDTERWQAYRHQLKRHDGSICPGVPLYRRPAPPSLPADEPETRMALSHLRALLDAPHLAGDYPIAGMGSVSWDDLRLILKAAQTPAPTTLNSGEREAIARIVDHKAWAQRDAQYRDIERSNLVEDKETARMMADAHVQYSLSKADQIIALRPAGDYEGRTNMDMVREFHETFGVPVLTQPCIPADRLAMRLDILDEERRELDDALAAGDVVEVADALTDMAYLIYGTALEFGIDLNACFAEVHRSNMSKLGADGKPIYRDDGKVLKGPNYSPPDLARVLERQLTGAS